MIGVLHVFDAQTEQDVFVVDIVAFLQFQHPTTTSLCFVMPNTVQDSSVLQTLLVPL